MTPDPSKPDSSPRNPTGSAQANQFPNSQRRLRPWLIAALALLVLVGGVVWWRSSHKPADEAGAASSQFPGGPGSGRRFGGANRAQPVSVGQVRRQDIRVNVPAIGTIAAANTATV